MSNRTKLKVKTLPSAIKRAIACMGKDSEGDFMFIHLKSRAFLDKTYNNVLALIKAEYNLPKREKKLVEMTAIEKEIYGARKDDFAQKNLILCYDEESVKFKDVENELKKMELVAQIASFFDMEEVIEDESGKEITHWERFKIKKGDYLGLCKYLISEEGLGISEGTINLLTSEITRLNTGELTLGQKLLDSQADLDEQQNIANQLESELEGEENEPESDIAE